MYAILKNLLRKFLNPLGFDIVRYRDPFNLELYRKIFDTETLSKKPFYNIGAGGFFHPYWTNIDYLSNWYSGMQGQAVHYDLMSNKPLPINDGSAKIIYTSHTIEHINYAAVENLFNEAFRCLEPGGVFRITTGPDAETDFRALMRNDESWFYWDYQYVGKGEYEFMFHEPAPSRPLSERWLHHVAGQLAPNDISPSNKKYRDDEIRSAIKDYGFPEVLDFFCNQCEFQYDRPGNHISWWTHQRIIDLLRKAGFGEVYRSGFGQSVSPLMRQSNLFDSTHPQMSIYIEALR